MSEHDTQAVIDVATRATEPHPLDKDGRFFSVVTPPNGSAKVIDLEDHLQKYADRPRRKEGTVQLTDAASLVAYVKAHKLPATAIYADWRNKRIVAVLNDHETGGPGWGDHQAVLTLTLTPEWCVWKQRDGVLSNQEEFAEHIEDHASDISEPPAADMLELAQTFHASSSVDFKSQTRLASGQVQLRYEETIQAKAGQSGNLTIPPGFLLLLSVFEGMDPVEISARLRYRLREGHLSIGYKLDRPDNAIRAAVDAVVAEIERATELVVLRGTPRS